MAARACPAWDVRGVSFVYRDGKPPRQYRYHTRLYPDGHGVIALNGVWHPIPPTMTATQYMEMVFAEVFAEADAVAGD